MVQKNTKAGSSLPLFPISAVPLLRQPVLAVSCILLKVFYPILLFAFFEDKFLPYYYIYSFLITAVSFLVSTLFFY